MNRDRLDRAQSLAAVSGGHWTKGLWGEAARRRRSLARVGGVGRERAEEWRESGRAPLRAAALPISPRRLLARSLRYNRPVSRGDTFCSGYLSDPVTRISDLITHRSLSDLSRSLTLPSLSLFFPITLFPKYPLPPSSNNNTTTTTLSHSRRPVPPPPTSPLPSRHHQHHCYFNTLPPTTLPTPPSTVSPPARSRNSSTNQPPAYPPTHSRQPTTTTAAYPHAYQPQADLPNPALPADRFAFENNPAILTSPLIGRFVCVCPSADYSPL